MDPLVDVVDGKKCVIQDYIAKPLLWDGFKFDLRVYVLVLSIDPLQVLVYGDGLARLCTTKYVEPTKDNISKTKMHLTNFAINKLSKAFDKASADDEGSKRSIQACLEWLRESGYDSEAVWARIIDCMLKTIISIQPQMKASYDETMSKFEVLKNAPQSICYEIYGFDVMLDDELHPWLLEINHAPSFAGGTKLDSRVKVGAVGGAFRLLGVSEQRKVKLSNKVQEHWLKCTMQQAKNKALAVRAMKEHGSSGTLSSPLSPPQPVKARQALPRRAASTMAWGKAKKSGKETAGKERPQTSTGGKAKEKAAAVKGGDSKPTPMIGGELGAAGLEDSFASVGFGLGEEAAAGVTGGEEGEGAAGIEEGDEEGVCEEEDEEGEEQESESGAAAGSRSEAAAALLPWVKVKKGYYSVFDASKREQYERYQHIFEAGARILPQPDEDGDDEED